MDRRDFIMVIVCWKRSRTFQAKVLGTGPPRFDETKGVAEILRPGERSWRLPVCY